MAGGSRQQYGSMLRSWSKLTCTPIFSRWFRPDHLRTNHTTGPGFSEILASRVGTPVWCDTIIVPEALEVEPQDLRKFVDHQPLLCFGQEDRLGGGSPPSSCQRDTEVLMHNI